LLALRARGRGQKGQKAPPPQTVLAAPQHPKLPRHELVLLPVPLEEIGVRICCGPRDKVPVLQRSKLRKSAGRLHCAVLRCVVRVLLLWPDVPAPHLVAPGCWLRTVFLDNRLTHYSRHRRRVIRTIAGAGRLHVRKAKARRCRGSRPIHAIFLGHSYLRPSRKKSRGLGNRADQNSRLVANKLATRSSTSVP
jgi:hypothetical protein